MKKLLLILFSLLILTCDSDSPTGIENFDTSISLEDFEMPSNVGNYWTYRYYVSSTDSLFDMVYYITRDIIEADDISVDYTLDCENNTNLTYFQTYLDSTYIDLFQIEDDGLEIDIPEDENSFNFFEMFFDNIKYSIFNDNDDVFELCQTIYQSPQDSIIDNQPDEINKVSSNLDNGLLNLRLDYPLYLGKTWNNNLSDSSFFLIEYNVESIEDITINMLGGPSTFECVKISANIVGADIEINYYLSNIGLVKVSTNYLEEPSNDEYQDGTGATFQVDYNIELYNYNLD